MPEEVLRCIICGRTEDQGLMVCGHMICSACEQEIVATKVDDPAYAEIVRRLGRVWQQPKSAGGPVL